MKRAIFIIIVGSCLGAWAIILFGLGLIGDTHVGP